MKSTFTSPHKKLRQLLKAPYSSEHAQKALELLYKPNINLHYRGKTNPDTGNTLLMLAIDNGWKQVALDIITFYPGKHDINAENNQKQSALYKAVDRKMPAIATALLQAGASPYSRDKPPFKHVVDNLTQQPYNNDNKQLFQIFLNLAKIGYNDTIYACMTQAIKTGHTSDIAEKILFKGLEKTSNPSKFFVKLLIKAIEKKDPRLFEFLLDNRITPETKEDLFIKGAQMRLHDFATGYGSKQQVYAKNNPMGAYLADALFYNHRDFADILLRKGANPDTVDITGRSLLCYAATCGRLATLKLLVKYGADINKPDNNGVTPLMLALESKQYNFAFKLLELGANVRNITQDGNDIFSYITPLNQHNLNRQYLNSLDDTWDIEILTAYIHMKNDPQNEYFKRIFNTRVQSYYENFGKNTTIVDDLIVEYKDFNQHNVLRKEMYSIVRIAWISQTQALLEQQTLSPLEEALTSLELRMRSEKPLLSYQQIGNIIAHNPILAGHFDIIEKYFLPSLHPATTAFVENIQNGRNKQAPIPQPSKELEQALDTAIIALGEALLPFNIHQDLSYLGTEVLQFNSIAAPKEPRTDTELEKLVTSLNSFAKNNDNILSVDDLKQCLQTTCLIPEKTETIKKWAERAKEREKMDKSKNLEDISYTEQKISRETNWKMEFKRSHSYQDMTTARRETNRDLIRS